MVGCRRLHDVCCQQLNSFFSDRTSGPQNELAFSYVSAALSIGGLNKAQRKAKYYLHLFNLTHSIGHRSKLPLISFTLTFFSLASQKF